MSVHTKRLSVLVMVFGSACTPGGARNGRVEFRFPSAESARSTDALLTTSLPCEPELTIHAEEVQGLAQSQDHALTSGVSFLFENYFTFPSSKALLVGDEFDPSLSLELPVDTSWSFSARGAAVLRAADASAVTSLSDSSKITSDGTGGVFRPRASMSTEFQGRVWTCGDAAAWTAASVTTAPSTSDLEISQVVIPLFAKDSDPISPSASQSTTIALDVTAAKLPFGFYATSHLQDFGLIASGVSPTPLVSEMDPFVNIQLKNLTSLTPIEVAASFATMKAIPLVKNLETSEVWRGVGGPIQFYNSSGSPLLHLNPLPGVGRYRIGVLLECPGSASTPGCARFGSTPTTLTPGSRLCLTADVNLAAGEVSGLTRVLASSDLAWDLDMDPAVSSLWTVHYNSATPSALATSCTSLFFD